MDPDRNTGKHTKTEETLNVFRESLENSTDAIGMSTPQGRHYYQNRAFTKLFGPIRNPVTELYADKSTAEEVFSTIMAGGSWEGEVKMNARDGRILDILLRAYANKNQDGKIISLVGIHTDITERKKADTILRKSEERAKKQRAALAKLVLDDVVVAGEIPAAFKKITEVLADTVDIERASIWILDGEGSELNCLSLYEAGKKKHSSGPVLKTKEIPTYFQAILDESRIYSENAMQDSRTVELTDNYLKPLGITSILDAGIIIEGKVKGIVCLEHVGEKRTWHADEEAFASTISSLTAQILIIAERKRVNESLKFQLEYEKMVSEISSYFINLPGENIDDGIDFTLEKVGRLFRVERSYLFLLNDDGKTVSNTHEWSAEGIEPLLENLQNIPLGSLPWWEEQIRKRRHVYIPDVDLLPTEAEAEKELFQAQGIRSLLCVPIFINNILSGFFGFDVVREKKAWPEGHIVLLKVIAELIASALTRHQADNTIRYLSFHDQLTGLYNRYYLEEEMDRLDTERQLPLSMIMADLNGLKLINDTYGHQKGDQMLKAAARILSKSCREGDIIARWGGDEFIIFLSRTPVEKAWAISKRIAVNCRNIFTEELPLSIALGVASKTDQSVKLTETLREAEDHMYKQKLIESRSTKNAVLQALLKTLAEKSFETEEHTRRMKEVGHKIGSRMNLSDTELQRLELLITLHDIGKINIAEEILTKKGELATQEWDAIKRHPEIGYRIAVATEDFAHVAEDILSHHEHWDGSGYPRGLKGDQIPVLARITTIADAYEVMSNGRPYKRAMSRAEIITELQDCSGSHFDPQIAAIFTSILVGES